MNIDGYEFSIPEMVQGKVGYMIVRHCFIVDHSSQLEKYLRDKGYLKEDCTDKEAMQALKWFNDSVLFFHLGDDISIKYLKDNMGIDYLGSDSDNLQNHYHTAPKHISSVGQEGNVLGTSENTKGTKKDAEYPSIILYDGEDNTIGRCDSITGDATSGVYNILYLRGVDFHKGKNIDDLKKVEVTLSSTGSESYLVLTSMKLPGSDNSFRCTTLSLNGGVEYE